MISSVEPLFYKLPKHPQLKQYGDEVYEGSIDEVR